LGRTRSSLRRGLISNLSRPRVITERGTKRHHRFAMAKDELGIRLSRTAAVRRSQDLRGSLKVEGDQSIVSGTIRAMCAHVGPRKVWATADNLKRLVDRLVDPAVITSGLMEPSIGQFKFEKTEHVPLTRERHANARFVDPNDY